MPKINTFSIAAITQAVQNIPQNQRDSIESYLLANTDRTPPADATLNTLLTTRFPMASLYLSNPRGREARRELSDIAWQTMLLLVAGQAAIDRPAGVSHPVSILFRPETDPESEAHNNILRVAIAEKNMAELAEHYNNHLNRLESYNREELEHLTDSELVNKFSHLYALYTVAQDASHLLDPKNPDGIGSHLPDESRDRLQKLSGDLPLFAALMARFEMICHPYYEKVDTDRLVQEGDIASKVTDLSKDSNDAQFFAQLQQQADRVFDLQLSRQLQRSNVDISTVKIYDLEQQEYSLNASSTHSCAQAYRQGKALVCRDAQGHQMAFRPEKGQLVESHAQSLVDSRAYALFTTEMDQLMELATGSTSNPFWMLTGSSQYKDLKAALVQHAQLVKSNGYPPKTESLDALDASLQQLSKAAGDYLQHKDPTITPDMTFQRYMQESPNAQGMNAREKARLQAAFQARDLQPRTHHIISLSREMGIKNEPKVPANYVFYQGLLRKYNTMEKQLDRFLANPNRNKAAERITKAMSDPDYYRNKNRERPEGMDDVDTLLWEMQQMTELIDNAETLMGLNSQDRILDQKEAARMRSSKKFREEDPAALSVEALQGQMAAMLRDALLERANAQTPPPLTAQPQESEPPTVEQPPETPKPEEALDQQQLPELMEILQLQDVMSSQEIPLPSESTPTPTAKEQPALDDPNGQQKQEEAPELEEEQSDVPRTLDYKPVEFYYDRNKPILFSNSSAEVQAYLNDNPDCSPTLQQHLEHRMKSLQRFEKLEAQNPSHRPTSSYTAVRNGQPVEGEPVLGDTIMLPGVHERRTQNTGNGCWSVSLCSQFEYRGIHLAQEEIRAHRPNAFEANDSLDRYCQSETQTLSDYSGLVSRMLPNSALFQCVLSSMDDRETSIARLKNMLFQILTKENSPVSVCRAGHYLTVVGMDKDNVYFKNPLPKNGDPESIEKMSFNSFLMGDVELNWISDFTPSLGGSIEPDTSWCNNGIFYGNGRAYSSIREEASDPIDPKERVLKSNFSWEFPHAAADGATLKCPATVMQPLHLKYTRLPGSNYNADALKAMQQLLQPLRDLHPGAVDAVLQTAQKLQQGDYKENPDEGMLDLASKYMAALKQLKAQQGDPAVQPLQDMLTDHLGKIRTAVMDMQTAQYKHLIGPPSQYMTHGNEAECPPDYYQKTFDIRRQAYTDLKQGFAGMVYFHTVSTFALEDERWLKCLKPQTAKASIAKIEGSAGLNNMINDMYDQAKKFEYYTSSDFKYRKAFLEKKMGMRPYDENQMLIRDIPDQPDLADLNKEEAQQKLNELMAEKKQFFLDNGINPAYYDGLPAKYDPQRTEIEYRLKCFADLRASARSGNTTPLFNRCMQYMSKEKVDQPQERQPNQPENTDLQKQAQPEVKAINI